ncbi:TPA: hypothetical protein QCO08_002832 [Bacillus anthracis]|nr:hypothetical protein [Bacillus anthracis]
MPMWLCIQLGLLVFWMIFGIVIYQTRLWLSSFPLSFKDILHILFMGYIPFLWFFSTFVFGIGYISINITNDNIILPFIFLLLIPSIFILGYLKYIKNSKRKNEQNQKNRLLKLKKAEEECKKWVEQFHFLDKNMVNMEFRFSNDEPIGRIVIQEVNEKEFLIISSKKQELPKEIKLFILTSR